MIVVDPRFTRTAAKADEYVRIRSGSDIPFLFGVLHHIFKNGWEDKKYIARPRLRHGQGARRTSWPSGRPTRSRRPAASTRRRCFKVAEMMAENRPEHHRLVHGPDPAHDRQRDRARLVHPAARARQRRRLAAAAPTSSAATTTCRARPTSARTPIRCPATTASSKAPGSTSRRSGASTSSGSRSSYAARHDDQARHDGVALDRRRAREERADRPGLEPARPVLLGPCAELADARPRDEAGDGQARPAGRGRPVSVGDRGDGGDARHGRTT